MVRMAKLVRAACTERGLMLGREAQDREGAQGDEGGRAMTVARVIRVASEARVARKQGWEERDG